MKLTRTWSRFFERWMLVGSNPMSDRTDGYDYQVVYRVSMFVLGTLTAPFVYHSLRMPRSPIPMNLPVSQDIQIFQQRLDAANKKIDDYTELSE
jgi:hypothetical protein